MRKSKSHLFVLLTTAALLLSGSTPSVLAMSSETVNADKPGAVAAAANPLSDTPLETQAKEWINALAADGGKSSPFAAWKNASLETVPVGPGTHSWLVLVKDKQLTLGYLIIHAKEEGGFALGEYGTGEWPLFNEQALNLSDIQLQTTAITKTERVYVHPLQHAWKVSSGTQVYYMDAITGEMLPANDKSWRTQAESADAVLPTGLADSHGIITASLAFPSFNPYETLPWLTRKPISIQGASQLAVLLKGLNKDQKVRYTTESFDNKYRAVWSVVGYALWSDESLYVALDTDEDGVDRRYIPAEWLLALGSFYK